MTPPWMNHPPEIQIDDFGVWVIELDVGILMEDGQAKVAVGHDGPGHATCWGYRLKEDYLDKIAKAQALRYRPILIGFDPKTHDEQDDWPDLGWTAQEICAKAEAVLEEVFGRENIMNDENLSDFIQQYNRYPTITELAGKAIIGSVSKEFYTDECTLEKLSRKQLRVAVASFDWINIRQIGPLSTEYHPILWWLMLLQIHPGQFSIRSEMNGTAETETYGRGR